MAKKLINIFFIVSLIASISACATMPGKKDLELSLKKAVKKYWKIRLKGELKDAYKMEYEGGGLPDTKEKYFYKAGLIRKFIITKNKIKEVKIEGKNATVILELYLLMPGISKPFKQPLTDLWVWDRKWKHILDPKEYLNKTDKQ